MKSFIYQLFHLPLFCLQDVLQDKPVSLPNYAYDRCVFTDCIVFLISCDGNVSLT